MCLKLFLFRSAAIFLGILLVIVIVEILARFFYQEPWYEKLAKSQRGSQKYQYTKVVQKTKDILMVLERYHGNARIQKASQYFD